MQEKDEGQYPLYYPEDYIHKKILSKRLLLKSWRILQEESNDQYHQTKAESDYECLVNTSC